MKNKQIKTIVWSVILISVLFVALFGYSYIFPIPAVQITNFEDLLAEKNEFYNSKHREFEESLEKQNIKYTKCIESVTWTSNQIYIYKICEQHYLKTFIPKESAFDENDNYFTKSYYPPVKVDGYKVVGTVNGYDERCVFLVNNSETKTVTAYNLSGEAGQQFKFSSTPTIVMNKIKYSDHVPIIVAMEKEKLIIIDDSYDHIAQIEQKSTKNPTGFFFFRSSIFRDPGWFVAYDGQSFILYSLSDQKSITTKQAGGNLVQVIPGSQIYSDEKNTYVISVEIGDGDEKRFLLELKKILDFPLVLDPKLENINKNNTKHFFYGEQERDSLDLNMLDLRDLESFDIQEIRKYSFKIPGELKDCGLFVSDTYYFNTTKGDFVLPEKDSSKEIRTLLPGEYDLKKYPYEIIYGKDNASIRAISNRIFNYYTKDPYDVVALLKAFGRFALIVFLVLLVFWTITYHRKTSSDMDDIGRYTND